MARRKKDTNARLLAALVWHRGGTLRITKQYLDEEAPKGLKLTVDEDEDELVLRATVEATA